MLPLLLYQAAYRLHPRLVSGAHLHRRALDAAASGRIEQAESWFEAAAGIYRKELSIEPLARLRVHQLMARVRARPAAGGGTSEVLEIVRRLNRLDQLESLEPPFELRDARHVLAEWIERAEGRAGTASSPPAASLQAA